MATIIVKGFLVPIRPVGGSAPRSAPLFGRLAGIWSAYRRWRQRAGALRQLSRLDERLLRDVGLSRAELALLLEAWQTREDAAPRGP